MSVEIKRSKRTYRLYAREKAKLALVLADSSQIHHVGLKYRGTWFWMVKIS